MQITLAVSRISRASQEPKSVVKTVFMSKRSEGAAVSAASRDKQILLSAKEAEQARGIDAIVNMDKGCFVRKMSEVDGSQGAVEGSSGKPKAASSSSPAS